MNQREILTEDCTWTLFFREKYSQRTVLGSCVSERNTHRGLYLDVVFQREILTEDLYLDVKWELYELEKNTHRGLVLGRVWWLGIQLHCLLCTRTSPLDA
jgi:hypothetical protein